MEQEQGRGRKSSFGTSAEMNIQKNLIIKSTNLSIKNQPKRPTRIPTNAGFIDLKSEGKLQFKVKKHQQITAFQKYLSDLRLEISDRSSEKKIKNKSIS